MSFSGSNVFPSYDTTTKVWFLLHTSSTIFGQLTTVADKQSQQSWYLNWKLDIFWLNSSENTPPNFFTRVYCIENKPPFQVSLLAKNECIIIATTLRVNLIVLTCDISWFLCVTKPFSVHWHGPAEPASASAQSREYVCVYYAGLLGRWSGSNHDSEYLLVLRPQASTLRTFKLLR